MAIIGGRLMIDTSPKELGRMNMKPLRQKDIAAGKKIERADIVAWLRARPNANYDPKWLADQIELEVFR
jgi:hypothetical protein